MDRPRDGRAPAEVRQRGNRLQEQRSLYLRQHARNPVDWHPWDAAALALARDTDRPIFLSSGYASCHWCHVMEHEVFESDEVAAVLNRHFVCIKVDREELPAVDGAYMEAVQLLTGGGGWPLSAFLLPDRRPFFGGTYFPRDRFLALLDRIVEVWSTRRADLERQAGEITQHLLAEPSSAGDAGAAPEGIAASGRELFAAAVDRARAAFDHEHGGQAGAMKFPVPIRWSALLNWWRRTGDPHALAMVTRTLDAMARGGLRDHVGGGFHRYTVDPDWTVPHFEKMLYDNAQLASLFLEAGAACGRPDWTAVGVDTLEFLQRDLAGDEGPCYASLDADSGGEEGTYYVWTPSQLTAAAGPTDGALLADLLGVTPRGNFEHGASVITRRVGEAQAAARHGRDPADAAAVFHRHRSALRQARAERPAPGLDRKLVTAWNGLALSAFVRGFMATGRPDFRDRAERLAAYLERVHRDPDGTLRRASNGGLATGEAVLEDHSLLAQGLLDLYQITGRPAHLAWALDLLDTVERDYRRPAGGWFGSPAAAGSGETGTPLGRRLDLFDSVLPSGGSAATNALLIAAALTGDRARRDRAAADLAAQQGLLARAGLEMAGWLNAWLRLAGPLHEVVVAGDPADAGTTDLLRAAWSALSPGVVVAPVAPTGPGDSLLGRAPALVGKVAQEGRATAYVCREGRCEAPTVDPAVVATAVAVGWLPAVATEEKLH